MHTLKAQILSELEKFDARYLRSEEGLNLIRAKQEYIRVECCSACAHAFGNEVMSLMYKDFLENKFH
jgi:hypothetical protein